MLVEVSREGCGLKGHAFVYIKSKLNEKFIFLHAHLDVLSPAINSTCQAVHHVCNDPPLPSPPLPPLPPSPPLPSPSLPSPPLPSPPLPSPPLPSPPLQCSARMPVQAPATLWILLSHASAVTGHPHTPSSVGKRTQVSGIRQDAS